MCVGNFIDAYLEILKKKPLKPKNSYFNETLHTCRRGKYMNLEIISCGPKKVLRGETTLYM